MSGTRVQFEVEAAIKRREHLETEQAREAFAEGAFWAEAMMRHAVRRLRDQNWELKRDEMGY